MKLQQLMTIIAFLWVGSALSQTPEKDPTFEELSLRLSSGESQTIESTLAWLKEQFPQYMRHFTLAFRSGSLQGSSPQFPRAIVFGEEASMILTFNGHSEQEKFQSLEIMHFDTSQSRYTFHEIEFSEGHAKISPPNPTVCLRCHIDNKPLWEPYRQWPGIYGSVDDVIRPHYTPEEPNDYINGLVVEWNNYADFLKTKDFNRYQWLNFPEGTPVPPYINEEFSPLYQFRPNLKLTKLLAERQAKTIAAKITRQKDCFESFGPLLMSGMFHCSDYKDPALKADRETAHNLYLAHFPEEPITGWRGGETPNVLTDLLPLFGIEKSNWHLGIAPKRWNFKDGNDDLIDLVKNELLNEFPHMTEEDPCQYFPKLSESRLKKEVPLHCSETLAPHSQVVQMCQSCHNGRPVVSIDFNSKDFWMKNPRLGRAVLQRIQSHEPSRRMPPTRSLSMGERKALVDYLSELAPTVFSSSP